MGGHRQHSAEIARSKISGPFTSTLVCVGICLEVCRSSLLPHVVLIGILIASCGRGCLSRPLLLQDSLLILRGCRMPVDRDGSKWYLLSDNCFPWKVTRLETRNTFLQRHAWDGQVPRITDGKLYCAAKQDQASKRKRKLVLSPVVVFSSPPAPAPSQNNVLIVVTSKCKFSPQTLPYPVVRRPNSGV